MRRGLRNAGILVFLGLVGCAASTEVRSPKQLAQEQWAQCSSLFESVELVEIDDEGRIYYREKHASVPTTAYQRCLARIAYKQVFAKERPAADIVRRAYFTVEALGKGPFSELNRNVPPRVTQFPSSSLARFHYWIEASDRQINVRLEWFDDSGTRAVQNRKMGPTDERYLASIRTDSFRLGRHGDTKFVGVRLIVEGIEAGEYIAEIVP